MTTELTFTTTDSDWTPPTSYPDLSDRSTIAIDLEITFGLERKNNEKIHT